MEAVETPITNRALNWVDAILGNQIPSCKKIKLACKRFKKDLKRAGTDQFPFVFDAEAAEHMCAFIEMLPHIEGKWAERGETITLMDWQAFLIAQIGGWRHMLTGNRRFKTAYIEVPRKNGKSTLLAGVGLYFLGPDGEHGAKVYSAASSTDQAKIVFDCARVMVKNGTYNGTPLEDLLGFDVEQHKINTEDEAAVFRPIASQTKSKDGKNPHCAIIDELHEHPNRDVWDSMSSALGAREQPLLIAITTAGHNTAGICYEQRKYTTRVLNGDLVDDSFFGLIFEADEGDEVGDLATWEKANPSLGEAKSVQYMQDQWAQAKASPAAMGEFLRKHLNIWTSVGASALDMEAWRASEDLEMRLEDYAGRKAYVGVDLATRNDFSSVVVVIPDGKEFRVFSWHFLPENNAHAAGNEHIWAWVKDRQVLTTPGAELDLNMVEALVMQLAGQGDDTWGFAGLPSLDVEMVVYDPMFAAQMAANWDGRGIPAVELRPRATNLNLPFHKLIAAVEDHRLISNGDPVLRWMASNTLLKQVQGGDFIYPAKLAPEDKIDGVAALLNALWPLSQVAEQDDAPIEYDFSGMVMTA